MIAGVSITTLLLVLAAGIGAGFVGYAVGASSLISYPALLAFGIPPVLSNTTNTVGVCGTGIGGLPADTRALVQMGTYALTGFEPSQQRYLYAPTHLNPTYEYGVTFERGTVMEYGDRAHVFLSGTASINNKGEVVHVGNIVKQTERMWENVGVLLEEGGASFDDVMQIIVYLRDVCDYPTVKEMFARRFPDTPKVITLAPVCRPTWLIEMECIAVKKRCNEKYRDF